LGSDNRTADIPVGCPVSVWTAALQTAQEPTARARRSRPPCLTRWSTI